MLVGTAGLQAQQPATGSTHGGTRGNASADDKQKPKFTVEISTVSDQLVRTPKSGYRAGEGVFIQLDLTNMTTEDQPLIMGDPFKHLRLKLKRDGKRVAFTKDVQARLDPKREESRGFHSSMAITLKAASRTTVEVINLNDWYGVLEPGNYELTVWRVWGQGHKSNPLSFEIVP
jgi:hypothetical protein